MKDTFEVHVTPKASMNRIQFFSRENGTGIVRAFITTAPEKGKANEALLQLLAKELRIPKSSLTIVRGAKAKVKVIRILQSDSDHLSWFWRTLGS